GHEIRDQAAIGRPPGLAAVLGAEGAGGGDGNADAFGVVGVDDDRVRAQAGQLVPVLAAVGALEDGGVLDAGVDSFGVVGRGLEVPDALELPGVLRVVVPLVRAERPAGGRSRVVDELVALGLGHAFG